jgi:tetratricopeptide (TPR) repeat protein
MMPTNLGDYQLAMELGLRNLRSGKTAEGTKALRCALALRPDSAEAHNALGQALRMQGQHAEAIECYQRAIELRDDPAEPYNNLGDALQEMGRLDQAIFNYRKALAIQPDCVEASYNLATALQASGRLEEAIDAYRQTLRLAPSLAEAHLMLGYALGAARRPEEAIDAYQQAIRIRPTYAEAFHNLGLALLAKRRFEDAVAACLRAVELSPNLPEAVNSLGRAYERTGRNLEARSMYLRALAMRPRFPEAYNNLGWNYYQSGMLKEATAAIDTALEQQPGYAPARFSRAMLLLSQGDFDRGLPEYEARWEANNNPIHRGFPQRIWDGRPLDGKKILLHAEQGLGDVIQFVRYVPLVQARGGRVMVRCWAPLKRLLVGQLGIEEVCTDKEIPSRFDVFCPIGSLPRLFGTRPETIPANVPYLVPDQGLVDSWRQRLAADPPGMKVGLVWAGDPDHANDHLRSATLATYAPLAAVPGVRFYSLQSGPGAEQAAAPPPDMEITAFQEGVGDMASTAALMKNLDLIITVDTSAGHLAGAIGRPVWLLLHLVPDWRWMLDRTDTPWYPTMRLFRQKQLRDWSAPIADMQRDLRALAAT